MDKTVREVPSLTVMLFFMTKRLVSREERGVTTYLFSFIYLFYFFFGYFLANIFLLGEKFTPLHGIQNDVGRDFDVSNSSLSEFGVMGFDLGYSLEGLYFFFSI